MVSSWSVFMVLLWATCLLGGQLALAGGNEGPRISPDTPSGHAEGKLVHLLRLSIRDIYARNAKMLTQELNHNLAVVNNALRGDVGPVKRGASNPPGTTSLGTGPLYFLTRELEIEQPSTTYHQNVQLNERLFEIAGK